MIYLLAIVISLIFSPKALRPSAPLATSFI